MLGILNGLPRDGNRRVIVNHQLLVLGWRKDFWRCKLRKDGKAPARRKPHEGATLVSHAHSPPVSSGRKGHVVKDG